MDAAYFFFTANFEAMLGPLCGCAGKTTGFLEQGWWNKIVTQFWLVAVLANVLFKLVVELRANGVVVCFAILHNHRAKHVNVSRTLDKAILCVFVRIAVKDARCI